MKELKWRPKRHPCISADSTEQFHDDLILIRVGIIGN